MMSWQPHVSEELEKISTSVVIVSDSLFSGLTEMESDESGPKALEILSEVGVSQINLDYFPDDFAAIKGKIESEIARGVGLIVLIGGTGISHRDMTIEAVGSTLEKELPGFGEEFRRRSFQQVQERALLSRATAGVAQKSVIVAMPGSPKAVNVGLELTLGFLGHALSLLE